MRGHPTSNLAIRLSMMGVAVQNQVGTVAIDDLRHP